MIGKLDRYVRSAKFKLIIRANQEIKALNRELDTQRIDLVDRIKKDYRTERAEMSETIKALEVKLRDRNGLTPVSYMFLDSILKIEQEVRKIKKIFRQKEEAFSLDKASEIRDRDARIEQLERDLKVYI